MALELKKPPSPAGDSADNKPAEQPTPAPATGGGGATPVTPPPVAPTPPPPAQAAPTPPPAAPASPPPAAPAAPAGGGAGGGGGAKGTGYQTPEWLKAQREKERKEFEEEYGTGEDEVAPATAVPAVAGDAPTSGDGIPEQEDAEEVLLEAGASKWQRLWFKHNRLIIVGGAVLLVGIIAAAYIGSTIYQSYLISSSREAVLAGRYAEAVPKLESHLANNENDYEARVLLVRALLATGKGERAGEELDFVAARDSSTAESGEFRYYQAWQVAVQNPAAPNTQLQSALSANPDNVAVRYMDAMYHLRENRPAEAVNALRSALFSNSKFSEPADVGHNARELNYWRNFAFANYFTSETATPPVPFVSLPQPFPPAEAIGVRIGPNGFNNWYAAPFAGSSIRGLPLSAEANIRLLIAFAHLRNGANDRALTELGELIGKEDNPAARYLLAMALVSDGKYGDALKEYERINEQTPDIDAAVMLANAKWVLSGGQPPDEETLAAYDKAAEASETHIPALNNAAFMHLYTGNLERARELLERALEAAPSNANAQFNMMLADIAEGKYGDARPRLYAVTEVWPDLQFLSDIAFVMESRSGNTKAAKDIAEELKERDPQDPVPYIRLAQVYKETRNAVSELLELENGFLKLPGNVDIAGEYLLALARNKRFNAALDVLDTLDAAAGEDARVLVAQALINAASKPDIAEEYFELAAEAAEVDEDEAAIRRIALLRAKFYVSAGQSDRALDAIRGAALSDGTLPLEAQAVELLAKVALKEHEDAEEARAIHELAMQTQNIIAQIHILEALNRLGDPLALDDLDKIPDFHSDLLLPLDGGETLAASGSQEAPRRERTGDVKIKLCNKAIENTSDEVAEICSQIDEAVTAGRFGEAIDLYRNLSNRDDVNLRKASAHQNIGAFYLKVKDFPAAETEFAEALKNFKQLRPRELLGVRLNYSFALIQTGNHEEAVNQINTAITEGRIPARAQAPYLSLLAVALANLGDVDQSLDTLKTMYNRDAKLFRTYLRVSDTFKQAGNHKAEEKVLLTAQKIEPRSIPVQQRLVEHYTKRGNSAGIDRHMQILQQLTQQ